MVGLQVCNAGAVLRLIDGGVRSTVQVTVLEIVFVLPQPSVAVNDLVCEREQPSDKTDPSLDVTVAAPQASVAEAPPSEASICDVVGLQVCSAGAVLRLIDGGVRSTVQVTVLGIAFVLPQPSVAVKVLV